MVVSVRSFAAELKKEKGAFLWSGLCGHYVTVEEVQERIAEGEKGFRLAYAGSFTGRIDYAYVYFDEARNFAAAKGEAKKWQ